MPKKCPPIPPKISKAAVKLRGGTKKERSEAGKKMKEHQDKKH